MKIISETVIGSHTWKMNHKDSDIDIFQIYTDPTKSILNGTAKKKSYFIQKDGVDIARHEAEKVVGMLLQGNINFIVGVLSPEINISSNEFELLRIITKENLAKNCYHSIHGCAIHNQMKYEKAGKITEKKWNQLIRILDFGSRILNDKGVKFEPVKNGFKELYLEKLIYLDASYKLSHLPEKPNPRPFRSWLLDLRLQNLK